MTEDSKCHLPLQGGSGTVKGWLLSLELSHPPLWHSVNPNHLQCHSSLLVQHCNKCCNEMLQLRLLQNLSQASETSQPSLAPQGNSH